MLRPEAVNLLAVLVAAAAHQAIGFLWYGPLFGRIWMREIGRTEEELRRGATRAIVTATIASLVMAFAFALLLTLADAPNVVTGVVWGLVLGIGFVATTTVINGVFEDRKPTVIALFAVYEIVALAAMGAILGAWR